MPICSDNVNSVHLLKMQEYWKRIYKSIYCLNNQINRGSIEITSVILRLLGVQHREKAWNSNFYFTLISMRTRILGEEERQYICKIGELVVLNLNQKFLHEPKRYFILNSYEMAKILVMHEWNLLNWNQKYQNG